MKFITTFLIAFMFICDVSAKQILYINAGSITGGQAAYSKEIVSELKQNGFDVDLKTTNVNCALAKTLWDNSNGPTIFITATNSEATTRKNEPACYIETNRQNFLYYLNSGITSFCSTGNKTWKDFTEQNSSHIVMTMSDMTQENFIHELAKSYNVNVKTIRVHAYNDAMTMVKSKEVDFIFRVSVHVTPELKDKCFWNHTEIDEKKLFPKLAHMSNVYNKFGEQMFLMTKGLSNEEIDTIRIHVRNVVRNNSEVRKQIDRRGQMTFDWNTKQEFDKIVDKFFEGY